MTASLACPSGSELELSCFRVTITNHERDVDAFSLEEADGIGKSGWSEDTAYGVDWLRFCLASHSSRTVKNPPRFSVIWRASSWLRSRPIRCCQNATVSFRNLSECRFTTRFIHRLGTGPSAGSSSESLAFSPKAEQSAFAPRTTKSRWFRSLMLLSSLGRKEVTNVEYRRLPKISGEFRFVPFCSAFFGSWVYLSRGSPLRVRSEAVVIFLCCPPPTTSNLPCLTRFLIWRLVTPRYWATI